MENVLDIIQSTSRGAWVLSDKGGCVKAYNKDRYHDDFNNRSWYSNYDEHRNKHYPALLIFVLIRRVIHHISEKYFLF